MAFIVSSFNQGSANSYLYRGNLSGQVHMLFLPGDIAASDKRLFLPPACAALDRHPSGANYGNRQYLVGGHTYNLLVDESFRVLRQGLPAPDAEPSVTVGAGTTAQVCYTRFYDEITGERGPLSRGKTVTGSVARAWTALPTELPNERVVLEGLATAAAGTVTSTDNKTNFGSLRPGDRVAVSTALTRWATVRSITSQFVMTIDDTGMAAVGASWVARPYSRASHIELWVAVTGALPRLAMRVRLGVTAVNESTATLALGAAETTSFEPMPRGEFNLMYNDRQLIAGIEGQRDTVYLSMVAFPERHAGLRFKTKYNEPIVGMFKYKDYVVIECPDSSYRLQGYSDEDMARTVLEPDIGGLGHHGNKVAAGRAFVPSRKSMMIFNGAHHNAIPTRTREWKSNVGGLNLDQGTATRIAFAEGFGVVNPNDETYQFYPNVRWLGSSSVSALGKLTISLSTNDKKRDHVWVAHYNKIATKPGGTIASPAWLRDSVNTPDTGFVTFAAYLTQPGERIGKLYRANNRGKIYVEDYDTAWTGTDAVVVPRYITMGDFGGGFFEGSKFIRGFVFIHAPNDLSSAQIGTIDIWPGYEYGYGGDFNADGTTNNAVSALTHALKGTVETSGITTLQPEVLREFPVQQDGHGFLVEFRFTNPKQVRLIGIGGVIGPGTHSQGPLLVGSGPV